LIAVAAVDRLVATGLERHLGGGAAAVADYFVHLTIAVASAPAIAIALVGSAGRTTAGLILKALFGEESLFRRGEDELGAAVTAGKGFVGVHGNTS
jgi:hypothetical protein